MKTSSQAASLRVNVVWIDLDWLISNHHLVYQSSIRERGEVGYFELLSKGRVGRVYSSVVLKICNYCVRRGWLVWDIYIVKAGRENTTLGDTHRNIDYRRKGINNTHLEITIREIWYNSEKVSGWRHFFNMERRPSCHTLSNTWEMTWT